MDHTFIGIDLGTSSMKLVLIDSCKRVIDQVETKYHALEGSNGSSEIDPEIWFQCMVESVKKLLDNTDKALVNGIGITGQMHTLVVLDSQGEPVRPAMMWNDTRTKDMIPALKKVIAGFQDGEYLSRTVSTGSPAVNLYWLKKFEPHNFSRIKKFLIGPDYLVYRLTGKYTTDYCEASTSCLYQISGQEWSEEMRKLLELDREVYPDVHGSAESAGKIRKDMAELLGLPEDIDIIVGTGDNPATAISTGCLGMGYPVLSLGTSGVLVMPVEKPENQTRGKVILFSFDGKKYFYLVQGAVQCNGNTFNWWNTNIMDKNEFPDMGEEFFANHTVKEQLLFYPHLGGEKTIYADPKLRGAFIGLGLDTSRSDMFYAVIEGLCFGVRELAEKMHLRLDKYGSIKVVGGGSKSPVWLQTLANVLNVRIEKMEGMTGAAFGIAVLSAYHEGYISSLEQMTEGTINIEQSYQPNEEMVEICNLKYQKYLRMRTGLKYINEGIEP